MEFRIEKDTMGEVKVPAQVYWGAQTQRNIENFPIAQDINKMPKEIIAAFAYLKKAAALTNMEAGEHWLLGAYGPNKKLEITVGGVYGYQNEHNSKKTFAYALPLLQAKFLFKEYKPNKGPGLGMAVGTFLPVGQGSFKPDGYGTFGYFIVSQCFGKGEQFLFHGNLGGNYLHVDGSNNLIATWGIGTQIKAYKGLHFVGEIFSGDPYIPGTGTSWQAGYRYIVSDFLQIDMTIGNGIAGTTKMPFWFSAGVRIVRENLF